MARPSKYSRALAEKICEEIAGGMSLRKICESAKMPSINTVRRWLGDEDKQAFRAQYARAREEQADHYADEIIDIADAMAGCQNAAEVSAAKLRLDARKWVASKLKPKAYGERVDHTSSDGTMTPQPTRIEIVAPGDNGKG